MYHVRGMHDMFSMWQLERIIDMPLFYRIVSVNKPEHVSLERATKGFAPTPGSVYIFPFLRGLLLYLNLSTVGLE